MSTVRTTLRVGAAWLLAASVFTACESLGPGPLVQQDDAGLLSEQLTRVAVAPFTSALRDDAQAGAQTAALVSTSLSQALATAGLDVIAPSDVGSALGAAGEPAASADPAAVARVARQAFGATAVVLGRVTRVRQRLGSAAGASVPASVAFDVSVHEAPSGRRLWTGRFDETQPALSANVLRARQYPGGGTRWLTADELAQWGAQVTAAAIATRRERTEP